jgi:hypothetical protein
MNPLALLKIKGRDDHMIQISAQNQQSSDRCCIRNIFPVATFVFFAAMILFVRVASGQDLPALDRLAVLWPYSPDGWFGKALTHGDWNADRFEDIAVSNMCGRDYVQIYYGGPGFRSTPDLAEWRYGYDTEYGNAMVGSCDLDGDGIDDLLVAAK